MNAHSPHSSIRKATLEDVPRWVDLAKDRYPGRDIAATRQWVEWCIQNPDRLVLVGSAGAGIAAINWQFGIERRAYLVALYTIPKMAPGLEAMRMLQIMVAWAKENGASPPFNIDTDPENEDLDLGAFVKRMGGERDNKPRYMIPF